MLSGIIVKGIAGFYYINTEQGIYECKARGIFRKDKITPLIGDYVKINVLDEKNKLGNLNIIEERKTELLRPRVSNVDQAVIVFSAVSPNINLDLLDRFIILSEEQNLNIVICINKADLDVEKTYNKYIDIYKNAGYKVILTSTKKGIGINELYEELQEKVSVFAGPSGVGKSSLINCLKPNLKLNTGAISTKIERGKHTTRHAELMELCKDSYIVDSPGFTSLSLNHISKNDLQYYFKEFEPFLNSCKFNVCSHIHEPDCAIKNNIGSEISEMRYERYKRIYEEIADERRK